MALSIAARIASTRSIASTARVLNASLLQNSRCFATVSEAHKPAVGVPLVVPQRILMGPGPSNSHPECLAAMALPQLGHMHPPFLKIMDDISEYLRYLCQTNSKYTMAVSGSGHAAMEAAVANILEPGEKVLVGNNGIWGSRVCELAERFGGEVINLQKEAGSTYSLEELKTAIETHKPQVMFLCQGESSAGTMQQIEGVGDICKANDCLLIVDTVCTLGGVPVLVDEWGIDVLYSGAQKALSCPPGASPFVMSERAMEKLQTRKTKVASYNFDMKLIGEYWGWFGARSYHHTGPISNFYALRQALQVTCDEGLEPLWARHQAMYERLWAGLTDIGLEPFVEDPASRLPCVNCIKVPEGVDWAAVCKYAMDTYNLEIAGGLGPSAGKVWRIGVMGYNAKPWNVDLTVAAFKGGLEAQGWKKP
mmetsp:Transcript_39370/g.47736  ORF Transcript_39370/g.47736 Transcript_39370/m.47736 type:complete len:422 (+) Transcript_39370:79-1344(+)|eukprot:CAMPEP_0197848374 /NCGR_PEP_ID=MMETSP1438-20131217/8541_1 /TAXON_ID=1461541 /ORGANISM="Pterosperma sp., Strain CCMP1384" /LENGTH=421 /DNA_ID=CAMNT_0043460587 /DNA_START=72 /DNA_END=1337 /DNA_ORIENTATION=-